MYLDRTDDEAAPARSAAVSRGAIIGGLAIAVFAMIFLRLWYLEVLSGDRYLELANDNRVRELRVQAPRGEIVDRKGKVLVANRTVLSLQVQPLDLPEGGPARKRVITDLARITGKKNARVVREIREGSLQAAGVPVELARGLGAEKVLYLRENQERFPGVSVERVFVRQYRQGTLAAHLFGTVASVSQEQLELPAYQALEPGDLIGSGGVEGEYDRYLRGKPGATRFQVDSLGRPRGRLRGKPARAGDNLRLTIDSDLQRTAEAALGSFGLPGAFVAMDVETGALLAMGSTPTFDPSIFTKPLTQRQYRALEQAEDAPQANRAIQGLYPTGSIFKAITATAALHEEAIKPSDVINDTGEFQVPGDPRVFKNAQDAIFGPVNLSDALKVSSDVYFYKLGAELGAKKALKGRGGAIQEWSKAYGLGERTGIDLPSETEGLVPTPAWRNRLFRQDQARLAEDPDALIFFDRPWLLGDSINLSVGQGDLQANPLQMAVMYAALGNGGTIVRPHVGLQVESATGEVLAEIRPAPKREIQLKPAYRDAIMAGLERAAMEQGGTSYETFGNFKVPIAGKTGTAERGIGNADQAWYAALAPADDPEIVVVVTIERGGFGSDSAAPVAARILERHLGLGLQAPVPVPDNPTTLD